MAELNIFQQGDKVKFIITSLNPLLNMEVCDFRVELIYGMRGNKLVIEKSDMQDGTSGEFVMIFSTEKMVGKITARFVWWAIDTDCDPDNRRQEVDEQIIGFVVTTPNPKLFCCPATSDEGHDVRYELTDEPDIASKYFRLCTTDIITPDHGEPYPVYRPLVTKYDEYIYVMREDADGLAQQLINMANNN